MIRCLIFSDIRDILTGFCSHCRETEVNSHYAAEALIKQRNPHCTQALLKASGPFKVRLAEWCADQYVGAGDAAEPQVLHCPLLELHVGVAKLAV